MADSSEANLFDRLFALRARLSESFGDGFAINAGITIGCQAVATVVALLLDALQLSDATSVIVYVLGVLATAILTNGRRYCLMASIVSIVSYNFFLIYPRFSLLINGRAYIGTITAMFVFALLASSLVSSLRRNMQLSLDASLMAQREQLRANLLRSISHDLRTPLTAISGNADMLLDEEADLAPQVRRQLAKDIYEDASWLNAVMENLLAMTRLEDAGVTLNMDIELIDDVIEEAMRHVSRDARDHHVIVEPSQELLLCRLDPKVVVQVIVNLVNNAIVHTQVGSTIVISSRREADMVAVSVADDGPGVPDAEKDCIFELFYSSDGRNGDENRSMGLGLALCRSVVQAHGGTIRVEDVDPHGARFVFTLPAEEVLQHV